MMDIVGWTLFVGHCYFGRCTLDILRRTFHDGHRMLDIVRWTLYVAHRSLAKCSEQSVAKHAPNVPHVPNVPNTNIVPVQDRALADS